MTDKFHALRAKLLADMAAGIFPPGSRIPSRAQLVRRYQYSRSTVDRVLASLIADRRLIGKRGSGTVVCPPPTGAVERLFISSYASGNWDDTVRERFFNGAECPVPLHGFREQDALLYLEKLTAPGTAVIWDCANMDSLGVMRLLSQALTPQLLINRRYHDYDSVATDQGAAMRDALSWLMIEAGRDLALVSFPASPERAYLYERLVVFYEAAIGLGGHLTPDVLFVREFADLSRELAEVAKTLFGGSRPARAVVVLHYDLVLPLVSCGLIYGKIPGRDYWLLSFDYVPDLNGRTGICMVRQRFDLMYHEALHWLEKQRDGDQAPFAKLIRPELITL